MPALLIAAVIVACSPSSAAPSPAPSSSASGAPTATGSAAAASATPTTAGAGVLKIGILVPFTESSTDADIGASQRRAAELYLRLQGGKLAGRDVQLFFDDESSLDPKINQVRIQQFLDNHVELLMGGAATGAATLLRNTAEAQKMVYIDTNASGNALTRTTAGCTPTCKSKYVFRSSATSWQMSEPLGEWVARAGQTFYAVYSDDTFGTESATAFAEGLAKNAASVASQVAVPPKSGADWTKIVAAIKAQPAKGVFAAFITDDAEGFIEAWARAGMPAAGYRLYGPGPFADAEVLKVTKRAGLGIVSSFYWSADLPNAENKTFVDEFQKAYREDATGLPLAPDGYAAQMWDAMLALDSALRTTKGDVKNNDAFIAALEATSVKAPTGSFVFDKATHNPVADIYIREAKSSGAGVANAVIDTIGGVKDPGQ